MLCQRHVEDLPVDLARCQLCHLDHELLGQVEGDTDTSIGERLHLVHHGPELNRLHLPPQRGGGSGAHPSPPRTHQKGGEDYDYICVPLDG